MAWFYKVSDLGPKIQKQPRKKGTDFVFYIQQCMVGLVNMLTVYQRDHHGKPKRNM